MAKKNKLYVPRQRFHSWRRFARPRRALVWAYGSNLSIDQMIDRCPSASPIDKLTLGNTRIVFRGFADLETHEGSTAAGGLWRIDQKCEDDLDRFEGLYRKLYFIVTHGSEQEECLFYQMRFPHGIMPPTQDYYDRIAEGYRDFDLQMDTLENALAHSYEDKALTQQLWERRKRQGKPPYAFHLTPQDLKEVGINPKRKRA